MTQQRPKITIIGSFVVGMTLRADRMPHFGETLIGYDFDMGPGGKGSNQAVGVARLGADAYFAGIIGADQLGEIAVDLYGREDVDTTHLRRTETAATGAGFIILNQDGENGIIIDMGANKLMDEAFVDQVEDQIASSDVVMSVLELPVEAAARAMKLGRKHGVTTVLNPAPAVELDSEILSTVDYLTPNETELRMLLGAPPDDPTPTPELARCLRAKGVDTLIVTVGERGALLLQDDKMVEVPGIAVDVIDTTGAGDAFTAGLVVALAQGKPIVDAITFANCAGALACTALGVIPALPTHEAVDSQYQQISQDTHT